MDRNCKYENRYPCHMQNSLRYHIMNIHNRKRYGFLYKLYHNLDCTQRITIHSVVLDSSSLSFPVYACKKNKREKEVRVIEYTLIKSNSTSS